LISLYFDDLIITKNAEKLIDEIKQHLSKVFEMKDLGELHYCLGLEVWRNADQNFVCQSKYVREILKIFKMDQCKSSSVPMQQIVKLSCDDGSKEVNGTVYRQMVGSLNYLTTTRPDISYYVSVLSHFMEKPHEIHWNVAKEVLRYLKVTLDYGIKYIDPSDVELIGYSDSDWAGNLDDRRSTTGYGLALDMGFFMEK
jgi:hypothetical protein